MLKDAVKTAARLLGFELRRYSAVTSHTAQLRAMFSHQQVDLVFDVGANVGQFGRSLRNEVGYTGRIVSFEPMRDAYAELLATARGDSLWDVAPRAAIGASEGEIPINIARNSVSSSVLGMLDAHSQAAPESQYTDTEIVKLATLDSLAPRYLDGSRVLFLKIDTQGYEGQVLQGAPATLARATGVQLELSLIPLYAGQQLMPQLQQQLEDLGFELWAMTPAFTDPTSGRLLQVDATFFRRAQQ